MRRTDLQLCTIRSQCLWRRIFSTSILIRAEFVIAALVADDFSVVSDIKYIQRGYEKFDEKLRGLGALIEKVETDKDIQKFKLRIG